MPSRKAVGNSILVTLWLFAGFDGNKQFNLRGRGGVKNWTPKRKLQEDAGSMEFQKGYIVGGSGFTNPGYFVHFGDGSCGGSLIAGNRVLTAAHCVATGAPFSVRVGANTQSDGQTICVRCAYTHPDYDGFVTNDLAVIKLWASSGNAQIAINTDSSIPADGDTMTVIGLGRTSTGGAVATSLLSLDQTYVLPSTCDSAYGGDGSGSLVDGNKILCAGGTSSLGSCNGDSGGPMYLGGSQVGIVSFGSSSGCAAGVPDGYTRVSNYADWITEQISSDQCDCTFNPLAIFGFCRQAAGGIVAYSKSMYHRLLDNDV